MYIGNIIIEQPIENGLFNVTDKILKIDKNIPTLIIGWELSKKIFSDRKLSILENRIDNNIYWSFSKNENRYKFEEDYNLFVNKCLDNAKSTLKYKYINILNCSYYDIKNTINILSSNDISYIYIHKNSFIYIYNKNEIIGLDFNAIDYLGIERKKIYKRLYGINNKIIFNDDFIDKKIRKYIFENKKIIPYLYAIQQQ